MILKVLLKSTNKRLAPSLIHLPFNRNYFELWWCLKSLILLLWHAKIIILSAKVTHKYTQKHQFNLQLTMIIQFPINDFTGPNYAPQQKNNQTFAKEFFNCKKKQMFT